MSAPIGAGANASAHQDVEAGSAALLQVRDAPAAHRYEGRVRGEVVAIAEYLASKDFLVFSHTEVVSGYEGRGMATALVRGALDDMRRRGLLVVPLCPFVAALIRAHAEEYADLVFTSSPRAALGVHD